MKETSIKPNIRILLERLIGICGTKWIINQVFQNCEIQNISVLMTYSQAFFYIPSNKDIIKLPYRWEDRKTVNNSHRSLMLN